MPDNPSYDSHDSTFPADWRDLRRRGRQAPSAEPPAELRDLLTPELRRDSKEVRFVERVATDAGVRAADLPGFRPEWAEVAPRPRRPRRTPPPRVTHHGHDLEPAVVWGHDDRQVFHDLAYPWGCVCKILRPSGGHGSGVIVGPRHVLTASHCIDWNTSDAETIEVHRSGHAFVRSTTFATLAIAYTHITGDPSASQLDEDYAVLVTQDRIGDAFGYFGYKQYDSDWDDLLLWTTMGYPGESPGYAPGMHPMDQGPVWLDEDEFDLGSGRAMTTSADTMKGQSGSAMFGMWGDVAYVVAVISAVGNIWFSGVENWCAGGADLSNLIGGARADHP